MAKIGPHFHKSLQVAIFVFISIFNLKNIFFLKVVLGVFFIWALWVVILGLPNPKMTSVFANADVDVDL